MPLPLTDRLRDADALLAPYAVLHAEGLGRAEEDTDDTTRFRFQRDRDRIIHSDAFRRLKHKTQVFVAVENDHFRTRLTHTMEVAQIARDMARTLRLNEDLAEAIALAHDLGHTPFGHAGEDAMQQCMEPYGKRFEHNEQSYRICTILEERKPGVFGLNLNREVLEGLLKHRTPHDAPGIPMPEREPSLEARIVNIADEIAYTAHDLEDGMRANLFSAEDVHKVLSSPMRSHIFDSHTSVRSASIDALVSDVYRTSDDALRTHGIATLEDVYATDAVLIGFSASMQECVRDIRAFLWERMYLHPSITGEAARGKAVIEELFARYMRHPPEPVRKLQSAHGGDPEDAVKDYIAGMTDTYAMRQAKD